MARTGELGDVAIGEMAKVWLPGETPWAECMGTKPNGTWIGRLDNDLVNTAVHGFKFNDVVTFRREIEGGIELWVPDDRKADRRISPNGQRT